MTPLDLERAEAQVKRVRFEIERNQRDYHSAIAFAAFIGGYPRAYVAECWRHRENLRGWLESTPISGVCDGS